MTRRTNRHEARLPPRGPAIEARQYRFAFDVDCGELVTGHRFIARGISYDGEVDLRTWGHEGDPVQLVNTFSLEYELVPGVPASAAGRLFDYLVGISYTADVALPWPPADGGAIAPFSGGASTHGSRGSWVLPARAKVLTFALTPVDPETRTQGTEAAGRLVVDLERRTAAWRPGT